MRSLRTGYIEPKSISPYPTCNTHPPWGGSNNPPDSKPFNRPKILIQRLTSEQMRERRDKGLCYNYDEKWHSKHQCKGNKIFILEEVEWLSDEEEEEVNELNV